MFGINYVCAKLCGVQTGEDKSEYSGFRTKPVYFALPCVAVLLCLVFTQQSKLVFNEHGNTVSLQLETDAKAIERAAPTQQRTSQQATVFAVTTPTHVETNGHAHAQATVDVPEPQICSASQRKDALEAACLKQGHRYRTGLLDDFIACNNTLCKRKTKQILSYPFLIDKIHKLLICLVPKTGVTSYTSMLIQYTDAFREKYPNRTPFDVYGYRIYYTMEKYNMSTPNTLSDDDFVSALTSYTKILTVRHPYTRLISFYKDKVAGADCKKLIGFPDKIIEYTRGIVVENKRDACNMNITFKEFFSYYRTHRMHDWNAHLKRVTNICRPCDIDYDLYLRTETATEDQYFMIKNFLQTPSSPKEIAVFEDNVVSNQTSRNAPLKQFSNQTKEDLEWMDSFYENDLELFGYKTVRSKTGLTAQCAIENTGSTCC